MAATERAARTRTERDCLRPPIDHRSAPNMEPSARIFPLNELLDMPTSYATQAYDGGPDADLYLLDYNYIDHARTAACFTNLAKARAAHRWDFARKTLLLSAKGFHPDMERVLQLPHEFRTHHVFYEL